MKPIDYRNETWVGVQQRVEGLRREVYLALDRLGPATTRALADRSGIDLLTLRPRVTELYQLGLVELANPERGGGEGVYRAVPLPVAEACFERRKEKFQEGQLTLL
jgi:sugar-specific transcriptional regulator TrmB